MAKLIRRTERTQPEDLGLWDPRSAGLMRMDPFRMVREMFQDPLAGMGLLADTAFRPSIDVTETGDAHLVRADLPGVGEEDVDVSIIGNRLTLSGAREAEQTREGDRYFATERFHGSFSRSFVLPDSADLDHVEAQLRDGVLEIRVPKRGEMKGRKVSIQGGARSPESQTEKSEPMERSEPKEEPPQEGAPRKAA